MLPAGRAPAPLREALQRTAGSPRYFVEHFMAHIRSPGGQLQPPLLGGVFGGVEPVPDFAVSLGGALTPPPGPRGRGAAATAVAVADAVAVAVGAALASAVGVGSTG